MSRTTVTVAYDRLAGEGFVASRVGAGTFVSEQVARLPKEAKPHRPQGVLRPRSIWDSISIPTIFDQPARFEFRTGLPDATLFPHETWRRLMARQLRSEAFAAGVYGHPAGHRGLREAIARHIGISRGVEASADDVTVTSGTQQALDILARVLLAGRPGCRRGSRILTAATAVHLARSAGGRGAGRSRWAGSRGPAATNPTRICDAIPPISTRRAGRPGRG